MSALGNLVVSLTAETAQFRSSMEKAAYQAQKSFGSIQRDARTLVGALAGYFSASMFMGWIKGAIDAADALYDLSERTGVATDSLSKLQYAARLSDVTTEEFSANLIKLNRSIAEAARGSGEAQKAFDAMGIAVKDSAGNVRATEAVLGDIAEQFSRYADGANKTALATAIFGRAGAAMITFLNNGREGLAAMGRELERLGGVVMPEAARRANEFNDNLERMKTAASATGLEIGNLLLPKLTELANEFLLARKNGLTFLDMLQLGLTDPFGNIQQEIARLDQAYKALQQSGQEDIWFGKSIDRQRAYLRELAQLQALARANGDMSDQISRRMAAQARDLKRDKKDAPALAEDKKPTPQNDEVIRLLDRQALAVQKLRLSEEELAVAEIFLAGASVQQLESAQRLADALTRQRLEAEKNKDQLDDALELYREYKTLYEQTASPVQKLADEEARLLELRERLISAGYEVAAVEQMIAEARMNAYDKLFPTQTADQIAQLRDIAQQFSAAIGTAFEDAIIGGENLRNVLKSLEQDIIRIVTRQLVTKPLERSISGILDSVFSPAPGGAPGGGVQSFIASIFGARALGGSVLPQKTYLVGEKGPEVFLPTSARLGLTAASVNAMEKSMLVGKEGPELFLAPPSGGTIIPNHELTAFRKAVAVASELVQRQDQDGIWSPVIAGSRANGGFVSAGATYLVGERGPEMFVPRQMPLVESQPRTLARRTEQSITTININVSGVQNSADLRKSAAQLASAAALAVSRGQRNL